MQTQTDEPKAINNYCDYLDSRDIQERIDWLATKEGFEDYAEFKALKNLKEQYVDSFGESSWNFGAEFIRESHFKDYAQELAYETESINNNAQWPYTCIDWEQAARELSYDYTDFDFDGVNYLAIEA